jgi:hypothetical protein
LIDPDTNNISWNNNSFAHPGIDKKYLGGIIICTILDDCSALDYLRSPPPQVMLALLASLQE